jgi:hypothetical protein
VLETELDTAEITIDEEFATVPRLNCIIDYHLPLHGYGQMKSRAEFASLGYQAR